MTCEHCGETIHAEHAADEHPGRCCDCFDLSLGMPLEQLNAERALRGKAPLKPWRRLPNP